MKLIEDLFDFSGRTIIITGGAGAIGSKTAELLSSLGANMVIADINKEGAEKAAKDIESKTGNPVMGVYCDATKEDQNEELVNNTVERFGNLSSLVNNVGWGANTPIWGSDTKKMVDSYLLNTVGSYNLTKFAMPHLKKEENASVVFSGSMVGNTPSPEFIEYSTAKAGLLNMVKSMAVVSGPEVRFNTIIIGAVDNGESTLKAGYTKEMIEAMNAMFVMKRRGLPADIAYVMMFLMSKAAAWITGSEFLVNGGGMYKSKMPKAN